MKTTERIFVMKTTERIFVYIALIALAAVNAVFLFSSSGRTAFAEASAWLQELGPADSLRLVDGDKELVLRTRDGRLAWNESDFKQTYAVAFVDISKALNPLMESAAFTDEREALRKELEAAESEYKTKLDAFGEQIQAMDRESPQAQEKLDEARKLYQEYMEWGQQAMKQRNELDVKHLQHAYRDLTSAVNVVADKLGVDIVLRFIPTDKEFKAQDAEQALNEIRLRTAVRYPEKLDITTEVLEELSLQDEG
jgi:Skp family chaperone for outer membrane proteins